MSGELVLVTGGSGFIGAHCIVQLLSAGYRVRTTVRSLQREGDVRAMLQVGGVKSSAADLTFVAADLTNDANWPAAVAGCDYVLHVASPLPLRVPKHEDELIIPAREGTLRVLRAARDAGVRRVVVTSSFAAIGYGHKNPSQTFDETSWSDPNGTDISSYAKSKTLAERAAWDFMAREGGALELATVNPVGVFGPVLGPDYSTSIQIVSRLLDGKIPACPRFDFGVVDVRDVADLHLRAMTHPAAKGERFLAVSGDFMTILQIAQTLKSNLGPAARRVPTRELPSWILRIVAKFDPSLGQIIPELDKTKNASGAKARRVLGWSPRPREEAILATAESLAALHLLRDSPKP
jgi:dihydroflavonol-4-reductase